MSETEAWTGKAKIIRPKEGEDTETLCKRLCEEKNITELSSYFDSWKEELQDMDDYNYVVIRDVVYDTSDKEAFDTEYLCHASKVDSETIEFRLVFYNGGTCFPEMLEDAIKSLEE